MTRDSHWPCLHVSGLKLLCRVFYLCKYDGSLCSCTGNDPVPTTLATVDGCERPNRKCDKIHALNQAARQRERISLASYLKKWKKLCGRQIVGAWLGKQLHKLGSRFVALGRQPESIHLIHLKILSVLSHRGTLTQHIHMNQTCQQLWVIHDGTATQTTRVS